MCILVIKGPDAHGSSELVSQNHQFSNNLKTIKSTCRKTELGIVYFNDTKASTPLASPCAAGAAWPPGSLHRQAFPIQAMSSGHYCLSVRPSVCLSVCLPTGERHQLASKDDCEDLLAPNVERISTKPMTTTVIRPCLGATGLEASALQFVKEAESAAGGNWAVTFSAPRPRLVSQATGLGAPTFGEFVSSAFPFWQWRWRAGPGHSLLGLPWPAHGGLALVLTSTNSTAHPGLHCSERTLLGLVQPPPPAS